MIIHAQTQPVHVSYSAYLSIYIQTRQTLEYYTKCYFRVKADKKSEGR